MIQHSIQNAIPEERFLRNYVKDQKYFCEKLPLDNLVIQSGLPLLLHIFHKLYKNVLILSFINLSIVSKHVNSLHLKNVVLQINY